MGYRADQAEADALLGTTINQVHVLKGNFVWDMPDLKNTESVWRVVGWIVNDWQLSGIWTGTTGSAYNVAFQYQGGGQNVNLTGSPDYAARILVLSTPGGGCSDNVHQQFDTSVFRGPSTNSVGLESGAGYLRGCFQSVLDLSLARTIRLSGGKNIQLRVDAFNAPNSAIITGRNSTAQYQSDRSQHDPESAVRRERSAHSVEIVATRRRLRGCECVSGATNDPDSGSIRVLIRASTDKGRAVSPPPAHFCQLPSYGPWRYCERHKAARRNRPLWPHIALA